jgi:hypothetical protein
VTQEGNIIHRTYQKSRILRAHYRRLERATSEQGLMYLSGHSKAAQSVEFFLFFFRIGYNL